MRNDNDNRRRPRIVLFLSVLILSSATSFAHPMGSFSVNHYSKIKISQQSIEIRYLIDMAEIPTFQEMRQFDITPRADDPSASRYLDRQEQLLKAGISLENDGQSVRLDTISRQVAFTDGAGGLPTMKVGFVFRGKLDGPAGAHRLSYFDNNFPGRAGWKEVVVEGDGVTILSSSAPGTDRSQELTNYSSDVLNSPPQQLSALVVFRTSLSEPERSAAAAVIATSSNRTTPRGTSTRFWSRLNGPNYFPFDPGVLYEMLVDNNQDGVPDVVFQFRFNTEIRDPKLFTGFVGGIAGIPPITSLSGAGSEGLSLIQTYTVTMVKNGKSTVLNGGQTLYAVPSNVGPLTMPSYQALFNQGIYTLGNGITVWAGTADDPFFIDLGAFFDSVNFRKGTGPILSPSIDADNTHNYAPDAVGGYNVNSIVLEVPIAMLTVDGKIHPATDKQAVIGTYGSTSRHQMTVRRSPDRDKNSGPFQQVNREGNSLINEAIIGTGFKDRFSMDFPIHDSQFAKFVLDPVAAGVLSSLGVPVPPNPRTDLLLLVQYEPPICPGCGPEDAGPVADLLRLNTGIPATPVGSQLRLGFIAGDSAGYPNGRRPVDDVFDISLRAIEGILVDSTKYGLALGDGVNTKTEGFNNSFPYVMPANSGRNSAHTGPGQAGCTGQPGGICPVN